MVRFPRLRPLCRAFLCAAAIAWAAESGAAAQSAPPVREAPGAALNEVSDLIDSLDFAIHNETDSVRREILSRDQLFLCAQADSLKAALETRASEAEAGAESAEPAEAEERGATPSDGAKGAVAAVVVVALLVLAAAAAGALLLLKARRGRRGGRRSSSSDLPFAPRSAARDRSALRDAESGSGAAAAEAPREGGALNTESLVLQPLRPEPKAERGERVFADSPAIASPDAESASAAEEQAPAEAAEPREARDVRPEEDVRPAEVVRPEAPQEVAAPESPSSTDKEEVAAQEETAAPQEAGAPDALSPAALTRLEQEDRLKSDILKLVHRGYTESDIARRLRMPQEQVSQVIRLYRERGE